MIEIPRSLVRLAKDLGVQFHLNEAVEKIRTNGNIANGIVTKKDPMILIS